MPYVNLALDIVKQTTGTDISLPILLALGDDSNIGSSTAFQGTVQQRNIAKIPYILVCDLVSRESGSFGKSINSHPLPIGSVASYTSEGRNPTYQASLIFNDVSSYNKTINSITTNVNRYTQVISLITEAGFGDGIDLISSAARLVSKPTDSALYTLRKIMSENRRIYVFGTKMNLRTLEFKTSGLQTNWYISDVKASREKDSKMSVDITLTATLVNVNQLGTAARVFRALL